MTHDNEPGRSGEGGSERAVLDGMGANILTAGALRLAVLAALLPLGCADGGQLSIEAGLQSQHPSDRSDACLRAARTRHRPAVPLLIERLEDTEAEVRLFAVRALKAITGLTDAHGYRYYASPPERRGAVQRWREWLKSTRPADKEG